MNQKTQFHKMGAHWIHILWGPYKNLKFRHPKLWTMHKLLLQHRIQHYMSPFMKSSSNYNSHVGSPPWNSRNREACQLLPPIHCWAGGPSKCIKATATDIQTTKEEVKLSLFVHEMIIYMILVRSEIKSSTYKTNSYF